MDARTTDPDEISDDKFNDKLGEAFNPGDRQAGSAQKLSAYGRARRRKDRIRKIIRGAVGITTVLIVWHVMAVVYDLEQILPPPLSVARTVFNTLTLNHEQRWLYGPNIYEHLLSSFARAMTGFTFAAAIAIPLGVLVGRIRAVREFVDPVVRSLYPIPGIAWIPLAILWFGLGNTAVIFVVFIAEFFPLYFNTEAGSRNINPVLVDAARCFGAKRLTLLRRVILPAAAPYIITGMRIALGGAWRMIVAGEMLASQSGIGSVLMESRYQFRATDLMMAMILISVVGYVTERLIVGTLEKKTTERWEVKVL
jgi:NitT/TauT family transport system permease protein